MKRIAIGMVAMALLAACGQNGGEADASASASTGPWSFTDDRHVTVDLDAMPERIIAQEDSAAALWGFGIRPIAVYGNAPLADNPQFEGLDITGVESVGTEFGELNIEKIAALQPDLIVTSLWPSEGPAGGGFKNSAQEATVGQIAPIVTIQVDVPYSKMISRYQDLAEALGADMEAPDVVAAIDRFETSFAAFTEAVTENPGLTVLAVSPSVDQLYVGVPGEFSDLQDYWNSGLDLVVPDAPDLFGTWQTLSWEQVDTYEADVVLYDARAGLPTPEQLQQKVPTWKLMPAVESGQIAPWYVGTAYDMTFFTDNLEALTAVIEGSQKVA
jgi:iron complex transport system substrate-binding protein